MVRLQTDPETRAYAERRITEGKSRREIIRCLKRFIARDVFALLTNPQPAIDTTGLRLQRERPDSASKPSPTPSAPGPPPCPESNAD